MSRRSDDAGRELAVLVDGPWAPRCYWRDDLEAMQQASRHMGYPDHHPSAVLRGYRPTDDHQPHPAAGEQGGRAWRYHRPTTPPAPSASSGSRSGSSTENAVARAHQATNRDLAAAVPAPRRPADVEHDHREQLRTYAHEHDHHQRHEESTDEREGVLW